MKKYTLFLLACLMAVSASAQRKEYKGRIDVVPTRLQQAGDSLYVGIIFNLDKVKVASTQTVNFIPTLAASGTKRALPAVEIKGRNNYLISKREWALKSKRQKAQWLENNTLPYSVLKGYGRKKSQMLEYNLAVSYEPWMGDAQLDMVENGCGCGKTPHILAMSQLVNIVQREQKMVPYEIVPQLAYIRPAVEPIKHRELSGEAFLDFVVAKTDIRPNYMNNPRELKKITDLMEAVNKDASVSVKSICVIGYASPEGSYQFNKYLSEARAGALVEYLLPRFSFPRNMYRVEFGGENWAGLQKVVEQSDMEDKEEILHIITTVPEAIRPNPANPSEKTSRKKQLMDLYNGRPYLFMLKEYFPSLRTAICKIEFEVKGFDVEEAKEVMGRSPQYLSLNEMYLVANTYEPGSQEFVDVFETAVRMFPGDEVANLNAAAAALSHKDAHSAQRYLDRVKSRTPEWFNSSGVAATLRGEYDKARIWLGQALEGGCSAAQQNLDELARKVENSKLIGE